MSGKIGSESLSPNRDLAAGASRKLNQILSVFFYLKICRNPIHYFSEKDSSGAQIKKEITLTAYTWCHSRAN
jgi:hypothetical protein